ncbi:hypothetical protein M8J75_000108 [Diaphorina citri]|nr:hypothetical protein M8J75_003926 [Diaphorina citri]KAI5700520.1 hypothetical protein M8J75_000108 [Diaphorina citri]KAI5707829.1 hypothetical protein M8J77_010718 [Diaphorina citri]KAI5717647.1 hypothetical protein M8J77_009093 [Diaphorina citri]KAI5753028.1 hypothetical protein M8J77_022845 [Diaphorina citri]
MHLNNSKADNGQDIVELFASNFSAIYSQESLAPPEFNYLKTLQTPLYNLTITEDETLKLLLKSKLDSSSGPDGIPPIVLKKCARAIVQPLVILFNRLLVTGTYPQTWKISYIIPIFKGGRDRSNIAQYRPICKISAIPKLFEHIIYTKLTPILSPLIISNQHGFIKNKSTTSNLVSFIECVNESVEAGHQFDCCATDYSKGFDKVNINILCAKLEAYGLADPLLSWFRNFLTNRRQVVKLRKARNDDIYLSQPFEVLSGCPQGGHLSGLLFNLYINDVHQVIVPLFWLYADDKRIGTVIKTPEDHLVLQNALDRLYEWCEINRMVLNIEKCKIISFTKKKSTSTFNYTINHTTVPRENKVKDLGVILESDLSLNQHYEAIKNKALRALGFINRNTKNFKNPNTYKILYFTLVRPILEYASPVWSPHNKVHIKTIEKTQRKFLKSLAYKQGKCIINHDYNEILQHNKMETLEKRRYKQDLAFLHKVLHNKIDSPDILSKIPIKAYPRQTRNRTYVFGEKKCRTNLGYFSPLNRILRSYNTEVASNPNIDIFHLPYHQFIKSIK